MRSTQKTETSSAGKQNPSTTEKKPLKVKVETVLIIIAMTGLVLTGITIGNRIHHHQMLRVSVSSSSSFTTGSKIRTPIQKVFEFGGFGNELRP